MIVSTHWRTYCCRNKSAMTLDIGSWRLLTAREIVSDKTESYLLGQKSLRQMMHLLVSKYLVKFDIYIYMFLLLVISEDCRVHNVCYSSNKLKPSELYVVPYCNQTILCTNYFSVVVRDICFT